MIEHWLILDYIIITTILNDYCGGVGISPFNLDPCYTALKGIWTEKKLPVIQVRSDCLKMDAKRMVYLYEIRMVQFNKMTTRYGKALS